MSDGNQTPERNVTLIIGLVLVVFGVVALFNTSVFPWMAPIADLFRGARQLSGPVVLILAGAAVLYFSRSGGAVRMPERGRRLYRSSDKKMVSGVIGGLSDYLGIDVTVLRLIVVALALFNVPGVIIAYIIGSVVIPLEPTQGGGAAGGPTSGGPSAPPPPRIPRG